MREIKFRVFSKAFESNKMFYDVEMMIKNDGVWWMCDNQKRIFQSDSNRNFLMQFTGLKDKHGKEIYCGDLYRTELTEKPRQVFFKNGAFCGGFTFDNCAPLAWDCEHDEDTCNELYPCNTEYIEIIGNIHSNPELLK